MSEERQRGGAARYLAMVACVLLGGFVYVGWRIQKGDELKQQHTLAAGIENNTNDENLSLSIPHSENPRLIEDNNISPADDLLSDLTIGSSKENIPEVLDTPDDIDIESLLSSTPSPKDSQSKNSSIGGIGGNTPAGIILPETEEVPQAELLPPPAPSSESFAKAPAAPALPVNSDFLEPAVYKEEKKQEDIDITINTNSLEVASSNSLANISYKSYTVKRGDTLSKIAQEYLGSRKRAKEIYAINKDVMTSPNQLKVGMKLKVPFDRNSHRTSRHRITTTDSLPSIAMRYYGSAEPALIEGIRIANPILSEGGFREGTNLTIPPLEVAKDTPVEIFANTPAGRERLYIVSSGDTLSKIAAKKYGNSNKWRMIFDANKDKISKPSSIRAGMTLRLP